ncbi:MAG: ABC transporter substrate-binding protein [Synergistaceae bacterium]|nr:ABC transporter substrate-binding protein [Synergistaceae bacterium]
MAGVRSSRAGSCVYVAWRACFCGLLVFFAFFTCAAAAAPFGGGETDLSGVKAGWAWPVIVIQPPEGWDSPSGESIKYGFRTAEREISFSREAIGGFEVTFMFSSVANPAELSQRVEMWRSMKSYAILSFGDDEMNLELKRLCAERGPSVIFAGGENMAIKNPVNGLPFPYLFALDYPYFARANALAGFAMQSVSGQSVVIMTDRLSEKLARGADKNADVLRQDGVSAHVYFLPAMVQNRFNAQVQEAVSSGAGVITSWLDSLSTLSVWRTVMLAGEDVTVCFSGAKNNILLDANGLVLVDKDDILNFNDEGKHVMDVKVRDLFGKALGDPVAAAKAYALGKWAINGFVNAGVISAPSVAKALSAADSIPLMDETLSIDPRSNRPKSRKFSVLKVGERAYNPVSSVDVYSVEVIE